MRLLSPVCALILVFSTNLALNQKANQAPSQCASPPLGGKKGKRQPTLVALSQKKGWKEVLLSWYGAQERPLLIKSGKSLWHRKGYAPVPVRWVLISDPEGHFEPLALCCSNPQVKAGQMTALRVPLGDKVVHPTLESGGDF